MKSVIALALAMSTLVIGTAHAQQARQACAPRGIVVQRLAERYGETLRSMGLHQNDSLVEIYSSDATGTWTILLSRPDGTTCLLAAGQQWEQDVPPEALPKPGKDA